MNITEKQAIEFISEIQPQDKVGLIFHDDLDGLCSGIQMFNHISKLKCKIATKIYTYGTQVSLPNGFANCNKVIFMDLGPFALQKFHPLLKNKKILSIDHHPEDMEMPSDVLNYRSKGYIPASRMVYELLKENVWLGILGTLGDVGEKYPENEKFVNKFLELNNIELEEMRNNYVFKLASLLVYFNDNLEKAFELLRKIKDLSNLDEIEQYSQPVETEAREFEAKFQSEKEKINKITFFYFEPKFDIKTMIINKISIENPKEILIFVNKTKTNLNVSARNSERKYNVADILKKAVLGLENASAGGHACAAGGYFQQKDLALFKDNLKKLVI